MLDPRHPQAADLLAQAFGEASALHERGRLDEAALAYQRILAAYPDQIDTLHQFGILSIQTGDAERGFGLIDRALAIQPAFVDAHFNRAVAAMQLGRSAEGLTGLDRVLALQGDHIGALYTRGLALAQLERPAEALASFDAFLARQPRHPDALLNRGVALSSLGRAEEALASFDRVIALQPRDADAHFNRGGALKSLGRAQAAMASFAKALDLREDWPDALVNHGVMLRLHGRAEEALEDFDRALAVQPDHVEALVSRGAARAELMRLDEAMADYEAALRLAPGHAKAQFNRGLIRLLTGDFEAGWLDYERRLDLAPPQDGLTQPPWDGRTPLAGKRLFLRSEQGLGDTIQFCRYAVLAADRGARVVLSAQAPLVGLLRGLDPRVTVTAAAEPPPAFDLHAALMSLPAVFETAPDTTPSKAAYLTADPTLTANIAERLGPRRRPRIGLVWSGAAGHENDHNRSAPLAALVPLLDADADWFVLQKDIRDSDAAALAALPIRVEADALADFPGTAALIANLDLVISVDTSIAHLAAALGKPTWVLLSTAPDWRWMLERADSPWYDSVRLFRQTAPRDWPGVAARVQAALAEHFG
jgi:tetratricopeptide (TPR) repeat protein